MSEVKVIQYKLILSRVCFAFLSSQFLYLSKLFPKSFSLFFKSLAYNSGDKDTNKYPHNIQIISKYSLFNRYYEETRKPLDSLAESRGFFKTAATYSPTVTQYHRRDEA